MLEQAAAKNVYKQLEQIRLGQEEFQETFPIAHRKRYDFVTAAGLVINNYMDERLFEEMLLSLRNGGIMVFTARFSYLGNYWYDAKLEELEKNGRIKALGCEEFFKYTNLKQSYGKFQKTPVKVFAFMKTEEDSVAGYQMMKKSSTLTASTIDSADC